MKKHSPEADLVFFQSNSEGEIVDFLQKNAENADYLVLNPGAFTHTSIAIRDAVLGLKISTIEVHLTNIYSREPFRRKSPLILPNLMYIFTIKAE